MKILRTIAITTTLLALGAATGCSSGSDGKTGAAGADGTAGAPAAASASAVPAPSDSIDPATAAATSAYLKALEKLDKKLTEDTQVALDNGQMVCVDQQERVTDAEQVKTIAYRFEVDKALATKILDVTKKNLCLS